MIGVPSRQRPTSLAATTPRRRSSARLDGAKHGAEAHHVLAQLAEDDERAVATERRRRRGRQAAVLVGDSRGQIRPPSARRQPRAPAGQPVPRPHLHRGRPRSPAGRSRRRSRSGRARTSLVGEGRRALLVHDLDLRAAPTPSAIVGACVQPGLVDAVDGDEHVASPVPTGVPVLGCAGPRSPSRPPAPPYLRGTSAGTRRGRWRRHPATRPGWVKDMLIAVGGAVRPGLAVHHLATGTAQQRQCRGTSGPQEQERGAWIRVAAQHVALDVGEVDRRASSRAASGGSLIRSSSRNRRCSSAARGLGRDGEVDDAPRRARDSSTPAPTPREGRGEQRLTIWCSRTQRVNSAPVVLPG